jgi:hypothetical protein
VLSGVEAVPDEDVVPPGVCTVPLGAEVVLPLRPSVVHPENMAQTIITAIKTARIRFI